MLRAAVHRSRPRTAVVAVVLGLALALAACAPSTTGHGTASPSTSSAAPATGSTGPGWTATPQPPTLTAPYNKVMVIAEENEPASAVIGSSEAPYINALARNYGYAANMQAGYPTRCPSLAAYILMTSGSTQGICDDADPSAHPLSSNNIFKQVADAGLQWRQFSESMVGNCRATNTPDGLYLVRHAPPPYYTSERGRCPSWDVPLGTTSSGALHSALASGLPAYSFVTPNACNDMHGAASCSSSLIRRGDSWLARWLPLIAASADFRLARLVVIVTWDEGSSSSNHVPALVVAPTVRRVVSSALYTHCSTLRLAEDILGLARLGCAATAGSIRAGFRF